MCERNKLFYRRIKNNKLQAATMVFCNFILLLNRIAQLNSFYHLHSVKSTKRISILSDLSTMEWVNNEWRRVKEEVKWRHNLCGSLRISSWCCHDAEWREAHDTGSYFVCHQCFMGSGIIVVSNITTSHHKQRLYMHWLLVKIYWRKQTYKEYRTW